MNSMSRDLAREIGRDRAAGVRHRGLADELKEARRAARRARREAAGRWWRRRVVPVVDQPALTAAPAPRAEDVTEALATVLAVVAERIAEYGTVTERVALHAVHDATRWSAPGAAAALLELIDLERECCAWIHFDIQGSAVTLTADGGGEAVLAGMFVEVL